MLKKLLAYSKKKVRKRVDFHLREERWTEAGQGLFRPWHCIVQLTAVLIDDGMMEPVTCYPQIKDAQQALHKADGQSVANVPFFQRLPWIAEPNIIH